MDWGRLGGIGAWGRQGRGWGERDPRTGRRGGGRVTQSSGVLQEGARPQCRCGGQARPGNSEQPLFAEHRKQKPSHTKRTGQSRMSAAGRVRSRLKAFSLNFCFRVRCLQTSPFESGSWEDGQSRPDLPGSSGVFPSAVSAVPSFPFAGRLRGHYRFCFSAW